MHKVFGYLQKFHYFAKFVPAYYICFVLEGLLEDYQEKDKKLCKSDVDFKKLLRYYQKGYETSNKKKRYSKDNGESWDGLYERATTKINVECGYFDEFPVKMKEFIKSLSLLLFATVIKLTKNASKGLPHKILHLLVIQ